ncbi:DUF1080 domain-containing protein [Akkermansiaceae bacterium]|nr:DUF1080 domain-containing protein [Akkermansiaceae bacterium]
MIGTPWTDLRGKWSWVGGGQVEEEGESLRIGWGEGLTAVRWDGEIPRPPFEMEMQAKRVDGTDFFCAVTFPVRAEGECVTLVVGGWGGGLVGISSIDGKDASENETTSHRSFDTDVWYRIRLLRQGERIATWIDGQKVIDVDTTGKKLSLRYGPISDCAPFGLATWQTTGMIRNVRWRPL